MIVTSFEYFKYQVSPVLGKPGYWFVSPAYGEPLQWGETYEDCWEQSLEQCLKSLDCSENELMSLH